MSGVILFTPVSDMNTSACLRVQSGEAPGTEITVIFSDLQLGVLKYCNFITILLFLPSPSHPSFSPHCLLRNQKLKLAVVEPELDLDQRTGHNPHAPVNPREHVPINHGQ